MLSCKKGDESSSAPRTAPASSEEPVLGEVPPAASTTPGRSSSAVSSAWGGLEVHVIGAPLATARRALFLLHGYGADAEDLRQVGQLLSAGSREETAILLPQAPIDLERGGFAWFHMDGAGFDAALAQLRTLLAHFHERHPQLPYALGGFSQGAILTANLLSSTAPTLRALLIFSGADIVGAPPSTDAVRRPVFASHGRQDRVLAFNQGKRLADAFTAWGYPVKWVPFDGGHAIPREIIVSAEAFLEDSFDAKARLR